MCGRYVCQRASAIAPLTPNNATDHGPIQHRPMNDASALRPTAPPALAADLHSSFMLPLQIDLFNAQVRCATWHMHGRSMRTRPIRRPSTRFVPLRPTTQPYPVHKHKHMHLPHTTPPPP